jgi:hypothetical protein
MDDAIGQALLCPGREVLPFRGDCQGLGVAEGIVKGSARRSEESISLLPIIF